MLHSKENHWPSSIIMGVILILGAIYLFADSMNLYPAYVHAWTQSDRIALAQNFQLNGFDFFHPATFNLLTKDGITQVDFPIHDYLVAYISYFFDWDLIKTFRSYNLVYSLIGLYFFFRLSLLILKSPLKSIYATAFLFTLPFFAYYQNGFLPSAPSFANFLIGIYFIFKAESFTDQKGFKTGVFFLTLAALARSTFFIYLFALFVWICWQQLRSKKIRIKATLITLLGILVFIGYYFYNQYLGEKYGSMFLGELLYFRSFSQFIDIISIALERWSDQLFSPFHSILLIFLLVVTISQFNKNGIQQRVIRKVLVYLSIAAIGVLGFFLAFGQQFAEHDYYYIDSLLPLLSLLLIVLLSALKIPKKWYSPVAVLCGIFFFYFFSNAKQNQENRYTPPYNDRIEYAYNCYVNAKSDFQNWGINSNDTILVIDANSTNIPFTVWNTKGYTNLNSGEAVLGKQLDSNFTYAVLIDSLFRSGTFVAYPDLIKRLDLVHSNGELSLYKKSKDLTSVRFFRNLIYYGYSDFESNSNIIDSIAFPWTPKIADSLNGKALSIPAEYDFPFTIRQKANTLLPDLPVYVLFLADYKQAVSKDIQLVISTGDFYHSHYLVNELKQTGEWENLLLKYQIPAQEIVEGQEISLYFWNPLQHEVLLDNLKILIYQ
tara:strand:- start:1371 stop:3350 length:1980 start_codon:yes stop_codon:yes gene_type:complete